MEIITDLNTLCGNCGFFDNESPVNNGYGCKHKRCYNGEWLNKKEDYINNTDAKIAISLTKRNIKCSKRLAKKYWKKVKSMSEEEKEERLNKLGVKFYGKCYSFSCPISYEVSFGSFDDYKNGDEFKDIEDEKDMPWGFGDELMAVTVKEAENMGISY